MNKLKVLMAHNYYLQGGGEDLAFENEVQLLRNNGHEVVTYVRDNREFGGGGSLVVASGAVWSRQTYREVSKLIKGEQPDIAHFHNTFPLISPSAYYAAREHGIPVVQTMHNYRISCPVATHFRDGHVCLDCMGKFFPWPAILHGCYHDSRGQNTVIATMLASHRLLNTWNSAVDAYIALGDFMQSKLVQAGIQPELIHKKPNFLPDPGIGEGDRRGAIFVGRLSQEKGVIELIKAWDGLGDVSLKLIGSGPIERELHNLIREKELSNVHMLGQMEHGRVLEEIKAAKFMVVPSLSFEGLPTTVLEAYACGTPVLVSDHGALAGMVENQEEGLKFPPGDIKALRAMARRMLSEGDLLHQMSVNARSTYERSYTPQANFEQMIEIYGSVLSRSSQPRKLPSTEIPFEILTRSEPPKVSIGIVTWNSKTDIEPCLQAIQEQKYQQYELVAVDNNSEDDTISVLEREFSDERIIKNEANKGFGYAQNQAIQSSSGKYYLALNPDVILDANYLAWLVDVLESHPECGSAMGKLLLPLETGERRIDGTGLFIDRSRHQYLRGHGETDVGQFDRGGEIFGVDGAAPLYRRKMLQDVAVFDQVFDESFFAYMEDVDLAWRSRIFGWKAWYEPEARAIHDRSFKPGLRRPMPRWLRRIAVRNRYLMMLKNEAKETLRRDWSSILAYDLRILAYILLFEQSSLGAIPMIRKNWPIANQWRQEIWGRAKVDPEELSHWFQ